MLTLMPFRRADSLFDAPARLGWLDGFLANWPEFAVEGKPLMPEFDISETSEHILLKADLPGMDVKNLDISVTENVLVVRGEKKEEHEHKGEKLHRVERRFGSFCRSFALPGEVKAEGIEASYKDGVLKIMVPKAEEARPKKVEVKAD